MCEVLRSQNNMERERQWIFFLLFVGFASDVAMEGLMRGERSKSPESCFISGIGTVYVRLVRLLYGVRGTGYGYRHYSILGLLLKLLPHFS